MTVKAFITVVIGDARIILLGNRALPLSGNFGEVNRIGGVKGGAEIVETLTTEAVLVDKTTVAHVARNVAHARP